MGKFETCVKFWDGKHRCNWMHITQHYKTEPQSSLAGSLRQFTNTDEVRRAKVLGLLK